MFTGKIALITGSGRGIGKAIALHLASLGADIVVNFFRNRAPAEADRRPDPRHGPACPGGQSGYRRPGSGRAPVQRNPGQFGGLDFLIHNAASGYNRPVMEQKPKGWDWTMNINARSLLFMAQRAAALMEPRGGGAIVSISSPARAGFYRIMWW